MPRNEENNSVIECNCSDCTAAREQSNNISLGSNSVSIQPIESAIYSFSNITSAESTEEPEENDEVLSYESSSNQSTRNIRRPSLFDPTNFLTSMSKNMKPTSTNKKCSFCENKKNVVFVNNINICDKCMEIFFDCCSKCSCIFDKGDIFIIDNKKFCCYCLNNVGLRNCYHCKKWVSNAKEVKDVGFVCKECLNDSLYFRCKECHIYYKRERYGIDNICINCTNNKLVEVNNYSYKPCPKFYSKRYGANNFNDEKLFFGVELEMGGVDSPDIVNDFASDCSSTFFYMKKDTSIPVYGCEVVTQPATLQKHIEMTYWDSLLKSAKDHGLNGELDKCGIHVHISRDFFTTNECAKMDCFVNLYQDFWKKIARRESHYSAYIEKSVSSWGMQTSDRRCALNLSNPATIELRIFKGSLDYKIVMSYIELCHALSMFTKKADINDIIENKDKTLNLFKEIIYNSNYKYIPQYCERYHIF